MHFLLKGLIIAIGLTLAKCAPPAQLCPALPVDPKEGHPAVVDMAANLLRTVAAKDEYKNKVISPFTNALALTLLENGADGKTRDELKRILIQNTTLDVVKTYRALLERVLAIDQSKCKLEIVNSLFTADDLQLKDTYKSSIDSCLKARVQSVDFKNKLEEAREKINRFISDETKQKIPELFKRGFLKEDEKLVLANAIHFKASWLHAFNAKETKEGEFYNGREQQRVPFMHQTVELRHLSLGDVDTVELPFADPDMVMYILLPKQREGLKELEKRMSANAFWSHVKDVQLKRVDIKLPKFNIRTPVDLKEHAIHSDLATMFTDKADFSRLTDKKVKIDSLMHEAYINVDENGTEGAAATIASVVPRLTASPPKEQITLVADHPFMFAVQHKKTGVMIYFGKVHNIEKHD